MQNKVIAEEWISKAEEDFGFASSSLELENYFAQICFHFQQAAEKYLKAFIIANGLSFRLVHSLIELLEICREREPTIEGIAENCYYLDPFYIDTRYPVHWPTDYDKETADRAKDAAAEIRKWVRSYLEC